MIKTDENDFIEKESKRLFYACLLLELLVAAVCALYVFGETSFIAEFGETIEDLKNTLDRLKDSKFEDEKLDKEIKELKKLDEEICKKILELDKKCNLLDRNKNKPYVRTKKANV